MSDPRYIKDMISQKPTVRRLAGLEKNVIPASIAAGIDLNLVEIHKRRWMPLTPHYVSVVRGRKVFYPNDPGPSKNIGHLAHMVHEVVHVWQYMYLGYGLYAPQWLDRRYYYNLIPGDRFQSFGLEQQAAIAEDSFRVNNGLAPRWARNNPTADLLASTVEQCNLPKEASLSV